MSEPAAFDVTVRTAIARWIRERGRVPTIAQVASAMGRNTGDVDGAFGRMAAAHMFIARTDSNEIYAYNPFCADPTDFRVSAMDREWWALCGWDALGIPAALGEPGVVRTTCVDCGDAVIIDVEPTGVATSATGALLHVGVPAREFWNDIRFT